jgi:outer membrane protein OmpA-like peptidoglycan-associated protein
MNRVVVLVGLALMPALAAAQLLDVGASLDYGRDIHATSFQALPGTFSCSPGFSSSVGTGHSIGAIVSVDAWKLPTIAHVQQTVPVVRIGYWRTHAQFTAREHLPIALDTHSMMATIEHRVKVTMPQLGVNLGLATTLAPIPLYFEPSLWFAITLPGTFEQGEYLVEPQNRGRFLETGTRVRNVSQGRLMGTAPYSLGIALTGGWNIPLTRRLTLRPELAVRLPLSDAFTEQPWRISSIRIGLSIQHAITASPPPAPDLQRSDTASAPIVERMPAAPIPPVVSPSLNVRMQFVTRDETGTITPVEQIMLETFYRQHIRPLLPYVFFEEGSATLPPRYVVLDSQDIPTFDESEVASLSTLEAYYHVLNIVGARLRRYANAELTITGCISNVGVESNRLDLARARAQQVRNYIYRRWGIDTTRLHVVVRALPSRPSPVGHPDGNAENARVELSSTEPAILAALRGIERQQRIQPQRLYASIEATPSQLSRWSLHVQSGNSVLATQSGSGSPPKLLPIELQWNRLDTVASGEFVAALENSPHGTIEQRQSSQLRITNRQDTVRDRRETFSLILFDFDDATITASQQPVLEMIRARIQPTTKITITGYTDRLGDAAHNLRLAERRALAVARALGVSDRATTEAVGPQRVLYDNNTPEGRFYSRTIEVELDHLP